MVRINNECYVSLEVAKLLKKEGFDWKCNGVFLSEDGTQYTFIKMDAAWDSNNSKYNQYNISAPTLEVAQRWLREVKGYYISISRMPKCDYFDRYFTSIDIMKDDIDEELRDINGEQIYISAKTYEKALEAGIKKALELILEKVE